MIIAPVRLRDRWIDDSSPIELWDEDSSLGLGLAVARASDTEPSLAVMKIWRLKTDDEDPGGYASSIVDLSSGEIRDQVKLAGVLDPPLDLAWIRQHPTMVRDRWRRSGRQRWRRSVIAAPAIAATAGLSLIARHPGRRDRRARRPPPRSTPCERNLDQIDAGNAPAQRAPPPGRYPRSMRASATSTRSTPTTRPPARPRRPSQTEGGGRAARRLCSGASLRRAAAVRSASSWSRHGRRERTSSSASRRRWAASAAFDVDRGSATGAGRLGWRPPPYQQAAASTRTVVAAVFRIYDGSMPRMKKLTRAEKAKRDEKRERRAARRAKAEKGRTMIQCSTRSTSATGATTAAHAPLGARKVTPSPVADRPPTTLE